MTDWDAPERVFAAALHDARFGALSVHDGGGSAPFVEPVIPCGWCGQTGERQAAALTASGYVLVEGKRAEKALAALNRWDCGQPAAPFNAALKDLRSALATHPAEGGTE